MTHTTLVSLGLAALTAAGCASHLRIFNADGTPAIGIPVTTRVLVRVTETTTFVVDPVSPEYEAYCTAETSSRYEFLPLGERMYVAFDPAPLGKGEFKLELTEAGVLKLVAVNSDATSGADRVGELMAAVLPYVASPKPEAQLASVWESAPTAQQIKARYCLKTGTRVTGIERLTIDSVR